MQQEGCALAHISEKREREKKKKKKTDFLGAHLAIAPRQLRERERERLTIDIMGGIGAARLLSFNCIAETAAAAVEVAAYAFVAALAKIDVVVTIVAAALSRAHPSSALLS